MAQKLWEKNFEVNKEIERFTVGRDRELDVYLAKYAVLGSMAHITMLESIGLLGKEELPQLLAELKNIYAIAEKGEFVIEDGVLTNYNGSASNVVIPDGVTSIERFAVSECKHIKKVTIPNRTHKRQYHSVADQRFDVIQNHVILVNSLMARCLLSF